MVLSGTLILNSGFDEYQKLGNLYLLYGLFNMIFACVLLHACYLHARYCMRVNCMRVNCMCVIACVILQECYNHKILWLLLASSLVCALLPLLLHI